MFDGLTLSGVELTEEIGSGHWGLGEGFPVVYWMNQYSNVADI